MEILNCEQRSDKWFEARKLRMTASNASAIGNCGAGLKTYIYQLCAEKLSLAEKEVYSNEHTQRGFDLEDEACAYYELTKGIEVSKVGFCMLGEYVGASPDGLVGDDGLIEIKCKSDINHTKQLFLGDKGIESSYLWQMQMQMLVTDRKWCDFVAYNPNFDKSMFVHRIHADADKHEKLKKGFIEGEKLIKDVMGKINDIHNKG